MPYYVVMHEIQLREIKNKHCTDTLNVLQHKKCIRIKVRVRESLPAANGTGPDCRTSVGPTGRVGWSWVAYPVEVGPAPTAAVPARTALALGTGCYFAEAIHLQIYYFFL